MQKSCMHASFSVPDMCSQVPVAIQCIFSRHKTCIYAVHCQSTRDDVSSTACECHAGRGLAKMSGCVALLAELHE